MKTWVRYILASLFICVVGFFFLKGTWEGLIAGGAFFFASVSLVIERNRIRSYVKKPGPFHEADSSVSMRRTAAAFLFVSAVGLFVVGALNNHEYAFFGGLSCLVGGVLMLFFTTWSDLTGLVQAAGSLMKPTLPSLSSFTRPSSIVSAPSAIAGKASTAEPKPPEDPSVGGR
jgi:hypothetical protein